MHAFSEKGTNGIMRLMKLALVSLSMLLVCSFNAAAQTEVRGNVTDESGDPLIGVSVKVKGSQVATMTDVDGNYKVNAPANGTLEFSYIGMQKQEVKISGRKTIDVVMQNDAISLDEVVAVGYGQQKKVTMTGAVAAVSAKDIVKTVGTSLSQSMVGKLPGMITMQSGGRPGNDGVSLLVRGYSSYNDSGTVLVIVDGVDRGSTGLTNIDPNEVESISVLKDAASCAIYGMKASNGVILITTKRGQEGRASISYRGTVTLNHATALPKMMNGEQYMRWYNLAQTLDGVAPEDVHFTQDMLDAVNNGDITDGIEDTNWLSPMYKTTLNTQHNLTISGGNQNSHYFVSGGFMKQNGNLDGQKYQRTNFRSNVDTKVGNMFDVMLNVGGIVADSDYPSGQTYATTYGGYSLENQMLYSAPYIPKTYMSSNPDDPNNGMPTTGFRDTGHNPEYAAGHSGFMQSRRVTINTAARVDWKAPFLKGFKASFFYSWDWYDLSSKSFNYVYEVMSWNPGTKTYARRNAANLTPGGNMEASDTKQQQVVIRPSISYDAQFDRVHNVSALFLYEQTKNKSSILRGNRRNFDLYDLPYLSFGKELDPKVDVANGESAGYNATEGFAGRFAYNYDEKYLAEFAFRYDGSYLFAPGNRWGFFPSASAGWVISKEGWFRDAIGSNVDFLKLRGSIGRTGNDNVTAWLYRQQYALSKGNVVMGTTPTGQSTLSPINLYLQSDLTWEKTTSYNIGAELTMWNGLLRVEFDWFYKYTTDILTGVGSAFAPSLAGNYPSIDNLGRFDNRGFELVLGHTNRIGDLSYHVSGNLSWAHNRILRRTESAGILPWQSRLGSSIGDVWGFHALGLYQTQDQLDNMPKPINKEPRLGDIIYEDIDGDGRITSNDQVKIARNTRPEMMFALNADANWRGFDLSFQLQGAALCDKMLGSGISDFCPLTRPWYGNWDNSPLYLVEGSWRPDNTNAEYPRLSVAGNIQNAYVSDFWKRNGSYLRLKNVTIGYTIPRKLTKKAGIENIRFFASGVNLLTFTDFKYLDPESGNYTWAFYPQQRTFTFGLDLSF